MWFWSVEDDNNEPWQQYVPSSNRRDELWKLAASNPSHQLLDEEKCNKKEDGAGTSATEDSSGHADITEHSQSASYSDDRIYALSPIRPTEPSPMSYSSTRKDKRKKRRRRGGKQQVSSWLIWIPAAMTCFSTVANIYLLRLYGHPEAASSRNVAPAGRFAPGGFGNQPPAKPAVETPPQVAMGTAHAAFWTRTKNNQIAEPQGVQQPKSGGAAFLRRLWNRNVEGKQSKKTETAADEADAGDEDGTDKGLEDSAGGIPPKGGSDKSVANEASTTATPGAVPLGVRDKAPLSTESLSANATVAACLYVQQDDADILSEWLAYHYHAMNLRNLIIAIDYMSAEAEEEQSLRYYEIFKRWKPHLSITEWSLESDYMPEDFMLTQHVPSEHQIHSQVVDDVYLLEEWSRHRYRRRGFLGKCLQKHKENGQQWVLHVEAPDEFVVPSQALREAYAESESLELSSKTAGNVLQVLRHEMSRDRSISSYPCLSIPRIVFGGTLKQDSQEELQRLSPNQQLDASKFQTLLYHDHAPVGDSSLNGHSHPNVLLDVSAIPLESIPGVAPREAQPINHLCANADLLEHAKDGNGQPPLYQRLPLATNRYLGEWDRYKLRIHEYDDLGRSRQGEEASKRVAFESKAYPNKLFQDRYIMDWLTGFVESTESAATLLGRNYQTESKLLLLKNL